MNTIREIQKLNQRELENVVSPSASWHTDYRDTAYIHIGGLSFDLTEGDIVTIFSQYGEPVWLKLARDKETGKSKGYAWLKYEDQRSCDLAVDNLGGSTILGRIVKVDHTRYKKKEDDEDDDEAYNIKFGGEEEGRSPKRQRASGSDSEEDRPLLKEERELAELMRNFDDEDPMKAYLIEEKQEEVALALARQKKESRKSKGERRHRHRHHDRRDKDRPENESKHRHRHSRHKDKDKEGNNLSRESEPKRLKDTTSGRSDEERYRHKLGPQRREDRHTR